MIAELMNSYKQTALELGVSEEAYLGLIGYTERLWEANEELNLFSRKMPIKDLVENHIFDCLLALKDFQAFKFTKLADFGSGGGMPAIILAICFPNATVRLFEKSPKKRQFLESQIDFVPNIEVYEEVNSEYLEDIDLITARAFKPIEIILKLSRPYFKSGGRYLLYKAKQDVIQQEIKDARLKNYELIKLESPFLEVERHLVRIP
jgi:16S rRNA (guanine527-N7)-methyltransferase